MTRAADPRHLLRRHLLGGLLTATAAIARPANLRAQPTSAARRPTSIVAKDGTRLYYRDFGRGRPLVFLAPWALGVKWWDYHLAALSQRGLRCVAFDRRGQGHSDTPGSGYDFDTLSDDLAAVIEQLSLRDVVLVGHSLGAVEIVRYFGRHGGAHVSRVVLIATITPITVQAPDNPLGVPVDALARGRERFALDRAGRIAEAAPAFFGASHNQVAAATIDWWVRMMVDDAPLRVLLDLHRVMTETDFRPDLRHVKVPTLLIHGDRDRSAILDRTSRLTVELIHGSELKVYENGAHGLVVTHAERLTSDLAAFAQ